MTSKPTDSQELKLGRGWTALSKNPSSLTSTPHTANQPSSRAIGSADPPTMTAAPRIAYTKAELLDLYEPGSTAAIPPDMAKYPGLTSSEPLVPVNIAPDDHIAHVSALVETSDAPPGRQRFQSTSPRPGVEAILSRDPASSVASQSAPVDSSSDHPSSSPPVKKTNHGASSTRDFWAGSAVLAPAERPAGSGTAAVERQKLALKSRPNASDRAASPNGHAPDKSGLQTPYWSRTATRGIADSKSNWRGGSTANPSVASGGAKYPGSSNDDSLNPGSNGGSLQNPTPRKSGGETAISAGSAGRSAFPRDRDGAFFGRSKEALKPTNTRDLSALASRGSSRDQPSSSGSFFQDRESRDSRHTGTDSQQKSHPDIMTDPRKIWFYRDPQGITQGPFPASQLMEWHKAGYYDEELPVSKSRDHGFKALAVAFGIRKDDALSRTPPPGFMKDLATSKKESSGGGHGLSGRPTREDRNRKMSKTVEEMAEEVEMMRLQKRKYIQEKNAARAIDGVDGKETSFFDETTSSTGAVNRRDFLNEAPQESNDGARAANPSISGKADETVTSDLLPHQTSSELVSLTGTDADVKAKSPLKQSRFASFMEHDSEESGDEPVHKLTVSDVERDIGKDSMKPKPAFRQSPDDAALSSGLEVVPKHLIATENLETTQSSTATSTAWGAMMKSLQQKQDQARLAAKEVPAMPATSAEQDLMAIDPAIAHASFARPSVNGSSSASSPRAPSSGTELPPWLQFSSPADHAVQPAAVDQAHDISVPRHMSSQMQSSLGMQATLQNQAQLHEHHARAQTDMQARAEAAQMERMRQMQAQVQQAQQAQAQQAQAQQAQARVAAQRASALAQAQAQAQAQAHAQVQAQVQAQAQLQAHAQASQTQTPMQLPSHSQEQTWALKHQLNQYQHRFDLSYRAQVETTRTLQTARRHAAATPAGSVEQRNYLTLAAQAEAAAKEHAINMERIKAAAANVHAQLLQIMAHGTQQQRDLTMQASQHSPQPGDGMSPVSAGHGDVSSPHQSNGNGGLPVSGGNTIRMSGSEVDMKSAENLSVNEEELVRRNQASVQRNLNDAYDAMAHAEDKGWERVNRKIKPGIASTSVEKGTADQAPLVEEDQLQANRSASLEKTIASQSIMRAAEDITSLKDDVEEPSRKLSDDNEKVGQLLSAHHSEQQLHMEATPTVAPWSKPMPGPSVSTGPSLREIQRQEELRNKAQEIEARTAQLEKEESKAAPARWNPVQPWGGAGDQAKHRTLNLREQIRLEEEQKRKKSFSAITEPTHTGGAVTTKTGWATLVAKSKPATNTRPSVSVVGKKMDDSSPFWDTVSSMPPSSLSARPQKPAYAQNGQGIANQGRQTLRSSRDGTLHNGNQQHAVKSQASSRAGTGEHREKKSSSDGVVVKGRISNEFANWCTENLQKITGNNNQDMTLVEYLVAIKSPSEIRETVVQNLGSSDKARSFADEFIRRLEFERSSVVADAGNNGSMGRKKGRRQRGAKVDPSLVLGFTSTSSSSRIMQGTIETPEMK